MLTRAFQKTLVAKAHSLKPVVQIGASGLTPSVHDEIEIQIKKHELIKIKISANDREVFREMAEFLPQHHHAELIQSIGRTIVLYRKNEDA